MKPKSTPGQEFSDLVEAAVAAIAAYANVPDGQPFDEPRVAAYEASGDAYGVAEDKMFPLFVKTNADHIAALGFFEESIARGEYVERLLGIFLAARAADPAFAEFLRSDVVLGRIGDIAGAHARATSSQWEGASDRAIERYKREVASLLVDDAQLGPYARYLTDREPELRAALKAADAKHGIGVDDANEAA
jgi:hypothetical protein